MIRASDLTPGEVRYAQFTATKRIDDSKTTEFLDYSSEYKRSEPRKLAFRGVLPTNSMCQCESAPKNF